MMRRERENCSNVSNSVLTDEGTSSEKNKYNYTGIRPEQFWGLYYDTWCLYILNERVQIETNRTS